VRASAAREGAIRPSVPCTNFAVNRARAVAAINDFERDGAVLAAVLRLRDGASACVRSGTTGHAANGAVMVFVDVPRADDTVNGARVGVATAGFKRRKADRATIHRRGKGTGTSLAASTASQRAVIVRAPCTMDAIFGTTETVAIFDLPIDRTARATILRLRKGASTSFGTAIT